MTLTEHLMKNVRRIGMDRRQKKTRKAIFAALSCLLETRKFEQITVQEIIDAADIGRSTFYAHFETKDDLLNTMCKDIFNHIITSALPQELETDYSQGSQNLELKLGHILYHLKENKNNIKGILTGDSRELFLHFLKQYLYDLFERYVEEFNPTVPKDFLLQFLAASFAETVRWWITEDSEYSPEDTARFFMVMIGK